MGGDGGTISSNRVYLRGAGKASHTADHPSNAHKRAQVEDAERARLTLTTCAVSGTGFEFAPSSSSSSSRTRSSTSGADIVACPHGKLYKREKALEALLQRSQSSSLEDGSGALGLHIRGMRDLHPVRFQVVDASSSSSSTSSSSKGMTATKNGNGKQHKNYVPVCPITGSEIGSGNVTFFLIVRSKKEKNIAGAAIENKEEDDVVEDGPNVLSERAIKEMGIAGLQSEYGPFEEQDMIRLAPPKSGGVFEEIQKKWAARMEDERLAKVSTVSQ